MDFNNIERSLESNAGGNAIEKKFSVSTENAFLSRKKEIEELKERFDSTYKMYIQFASNEMVSSDIKSALKYASGMRKSYDHVWLELKKLRAQYPEESKEFDDLYKIKSEIEGKIIYLREHRNPGNLIDEYIPKELLYRTTEPGKNQLAKQELKDSQKLEFKERFSEIDSFLKSRKIDSGDLYHKDYNLKGEILSPIDFDYDELMIADRSKSGEYSLNLDMQKVDLEKTQPFTVNTSMVGKIKVNAHNVDAIKYAFKNYGADYLLPGLEYANWLTENANTLPKSIEDKLMVGHAYLLPGSIYRLERGIDEGTACVGMVRFVQNSQGIKSFNFMLEYLEGACSYPGDPEREILLIKREQEVPQQ